MSEDLRKGLTYSAAGILGFSSILTQVLLLREFLAVLTGNELLIGILLSNWMLLTGIGAYAGRFIKDRQINSLILLLHSLLATLPLLSILVLFRSRYLLFSPGLELNLQEVMIFSFLLLAPFCLISGFLFNLYASFMQKRNQIHSLAKIYSIESAGSFIGGLFSAFILIRYLNLYSCLLLILLLNMGISILFGFFQLRKSFVISLFLQVVAVIVLILLVPQHLDKSRIFPGQELIFSKESNYGSVAVTETGRQLNFYENGSLLFSTHANKYHEEIIHYSFSLHDQPRNILIISGNFMALQKEIEKYENTEISYVEMNPEVVEAQEQLLNKSDSLNEKDMDFYIEDPMHFFKQSSAKYDLIIMNLPPPSSAMISRFYSSSFFAEVKKHLEKKGIFTFSLPAAENYASDRLLELLSSIFNTLQAQFKEIRVISGQRTYFLASQENLQGSIMDRIKQLNIENLYVNEHYIREDLLRMRSELLRDSFIRDAPLNKDLRPVAYYYQLRSWLHANKIETGHLLTALVIIIFLVLVISAPINFALFTGGFTAASTEFLLIIAFQVIYAYVYQFIGLIIAVFMLGLYLGVLYGQKEEAGSEKGFS
ncbi:MAG: fused MFS/spermidine synthase [Bacteroidota bacterium]|nr:fused MFS/spermidine synthase [Bacteroidota bacterium]